MLFKLNSVTKRFKGPSPLRFYVFISLCFSLLWACRDDHVYSENLPRDSNEVQEQSQKNLSDAFDTELLPFWEEWFAKDWRYLLIAGLVSDSLFEKVVQLREANRLHPSEPVVLLQLAMAELLQSEDSILVDSAIVRLQQLRRIDPHNGVPALLESYAYARQAKAPEARTLLMNIPEPMKGDFYYDRIEDAVLGLLQHSGQMNPFRLMQAVELYRKINLPLFEPIMDVLYTVFLEPLPSRPYDIRIRGLDAARTMYNLGYDLRKNARQRAYLLSGAYESISLGYLLQLKSAEFLVLFHRAFENKKEARRVYRVVQNLQLDYADYLGSSPLQDRYAYAFVESWSKLAVDSPELGYSQALAVARSWPLWKELMEKGYPPADDF